MIPKYESVLGPFNSVTTDFTLSGGYTAGSLQVFKNERVLSPEASNGWVELSAEGGTFRMKLAPALGDLIRVFYLDRTNGVVYLRGSAAEVEGELEEDVDFDGELIDDVLIEGELEADLG